MKTPDFWNNRNLKSNLLYPIGLLYGSITSLRMRLSKPGKVHKPVICIGNLTAGGTGKTPVSISIAQMLQENGKNPFFVSRGYGGELKGVAVNLLKHTPKEVGDEPLLLAKQAPVIVNPNRYEGALSAIQQGANVIIMDDGFQNPTLYKDLSFIVVDGAFGFGNKRCIPSGPLRESLSSGFKRAQAVIIIGEDKHKVKKDTKLPVFEGQIVPIKPDTSSKNIIAFAGIGRPEKFYTSLKELGMIPAETIDFPDHHQYTTEELKEIIAKAKAQKADIFTTSKDFVKIPPKLQKHFKVLEISIKWKDEKKLLDFILKHL